MTDPDWDDERLAAAFHARFDRPAPSTLARAIHGAIAGTSPARRGFFRSGPGLGIAAAAVVVVLIGTVIVGVGPFGRSGSEPLASGSSAGPSAGPSASAPPTEQALLGSVVDLPIITVSDAIAIRDAGVDDRELAVMGWFTPTLAPQLRCAGPAPVSPVQLYCGDASIWLTQQAESLIHRKGTSLQTTAPVGPAIQPVLDVPDSSWQPADFGIGPNGDSTPTDVVFIGHFDDRRAAFCPEAAQAACRDRFVVDSVARVAGQAPPRSPIRVATASSLPDIEAIIDLEAPQSEILSIMVTQWPEDLSFIEPSLADGQEGLIHQPVLWIVRVLESERALTYIVVDGTDAIFEMSRENEAIRVGGTPPTSTPGPWPPAGAIVIELPGEVGANDRRPRVAVVDQSGRLSGVAEKGDVDPATVTFDGRFGAYAEPGKPGRVHLAWVGGMCDSQITVTVAADLRSITFDMGPQPDCDSLGVGRELVLDFAGSVDVPAIELSEAAATPTAGARGYQLDCGPLGPDTCEQQAAAIVAANEQRPPAKHVVSITFTSECGSFTVIFNDGTGTTASIDCVRP